MSRTRLAYALLAACLAPALQACGDPSPATQKLQQQLGATWDAMSSWGVEKKDELLRSAGPKLEELKRGLADATATAANTGAEATQRLVQGWSGVEQKFGAMKDATGEQWTKHRDAFLSAVQAYKADLAAARKK